MSVSTRLAALLALLVLGTGTGLAPAGAAGVAPAGHHGFRHFVTRDGDRLMDGRTEFRFLSAATPTLGIVEDNYPFGAAEDFEWRWPDRFEIRDTLETIRQMGGQATRIYCISVLRPGEDAAEVPRHIVAAPRGADGSPNPAAFNEEGFKVLDQILAVARERGIRIVIPITNQYPWHGGIESLAAFRGKTAAQFYTDPELRADFKAVVGYLLDRRNTYTGVRYADDPTILAWAYGNELGDATDEWLDDIGAHIKALDANHLLMQHEFGIRPYALTSPYIDVLAASVYDNFQGTAPATIASHARQTDGIKPYLAFEFGFGTPQTLRAAMDTLIESGAAGGQLWGLRPHRREGGFYWHGEEGYGDEFFLRSYHWPGFASGDRYDERQVMELLRERAYQIRGIDDPPPIEPPARPTLLPVAKPSAISWQGSTGARSYVLERARTPRGPWRVVEAGITDDVAYSPVYNDASASVGATYWYRVRARNEAGTSAPSNPVGPVHVRRLALVDELADFSRTAHVTDGLVVATTGNRRVLERLARVRRAEATAGEALTYAVGGTLTSLRVQSFFADEIEHFRFSVSGDGETFQPLDVTVEQAGEGPGVYGYWYRIGYRSAGAPPGARYLRIEFPDLAVAETPQLDRVEIEYLPD